MIILGIETATPHGGAALWRDGETVALAENDGKATHSVRLMPGIDSILHKSDLAVSDIDAIAISIGPGSFTGLRIGLSVGKALAHAADKPVLAVSTLEALATRFADAGTIAAPVIDARRAEVFGALFRAQADGERMERLTPDLAESPERFAERLKGDDCILGGTGLDRYNAVFDELLGERFRPAAQSLWKADAGSVASLGAMMFAAGETADLLTLEPVYVRKPDAQMPRVRQPLR